MKRLAILQHKDHVLMVEDVSEEQLSKYQSVDDCIKDNYYFDADYSWCFINGALYFPNDDPSPVEVKFEDLI